MEILYTNADGIIGKADELKERIMEAKVDIVAITETKLNEDIASATVFPTGYVVIRKERVGRGGGGVAMLIKERLKFEEVNLSVNNNFQEFLVGTVNTGKSSLVVAVIYNPPRNEHSPEEYEVSNTGTIEVINKVVQLAQERNSRLIVLGDFNHKEIDWVSLDAHGDEGSWRSKFLDCIQENFLHQHVLEPTRARGDDTPSVLDLVFTHSSLDIDKIEYRTPVGKSDHCVLAMNFVLEDDLPDDTVVERQERLNYSKGDYLKMNETFLEVDWERKFDGMGVKEMYEAFCQEYKSVVENCIPVTKIGRENAKKKWFNNDCKNAKEKRDKCWKKYRRRKSLAAWQEYKSVRNEYLNTRREAERCYEKDIAKKAKENPKLFYSFIRGKLSVKEQVIKLERSDGSITDSDEQICEELNKEFQSVFVNELLPPPHMERLNGLTQKLNDITITVTEVSNVLRDLHPHKAIGPDDISPYVLKQCAGTLALPLHMIFNRSLTTGELPLHWKQANVVPIFKKGRRDVALNYRPVSLTSVVCKVMEKIVRKYVTLHLEGLGFLSDKQHGFREGRSTVTNLLEFYDRVTDILQEREGWADCVFLDFQKAFDTVPHKRLLKKLEVQASVGGRVLKWIEEYLVGRKQKVRVRQAVSGWRNVTSGVPQGSVLGPLLFLIYINDLPEGVDGFLNMFADDAKIVKKVSGVNSCRELQQDLDKLQEWSDTWLMKFNAEKCRVMKMGRSRRRPVFEYSLGGVQLSESQCEKDLGVCVTSDLSPESHINAIVRSVYALLANIKVAFRYMDKEMFRDIFITYVRPKLEYAAPFWSPHLKKHITKLEKVQRHATRIVPELRGLGYEERLKELNLPSLEGRRVRGDMITVFKFIHGYDKIDMSNFFDMGGSRTRGHSLKLRKKSSSQDVRKYFFSLRTVDKWNSLSEAVVTASSIHNFKDKFDKEQ